MDVVLLSYRFSAAELLENTSSISLSTNNQTSVSSACVEAN